MLEFDRDGNLVGHWAVQATGIDWPTEPRHHDRPQRQRLDWRQRPGDAQILKFTRDGKFLLQVGQAGKNAGSHDTENFWRAAKVIVDPTTNEAYVADGYGNRRVAVIDAETGEFKRYWGAYGNRPDDTNLGPYNPDAPPAHSSVAPCTAPRSPATDSSTSAIAPTTGSRCSSATARS